MAATAAGLVSKFALHPASVDERTTCEGLLRQEAKGRVILMPTHHVDEFGDLSCFRFDCPGTSSGGVLPISRRMFFGHSAVECLESEETILRLMSRPEENQMLMREFLQEIDAAGPKALLDCIPDNNDVQSKGKVVQGMDLRTVDCKAWAAELPECIGLYHAYVRGFNRDVRTHRLFLVCSGGLEKAADEYCNLLIDTGRSWKAQEVVDSEETWWLRRACSRARNRLLLQLARKFGLRVQSLEDIHAHEPVEVAVPCTETLENDLLSKNGTVTVFNGCCDTTKPFNGLLVRMHPEEGYWLFKGACKGGTFGSAFGDHRVCGGFPVYQPKVGRAGTVTMAGKSPAVVRLRSNAAAEQYMCFDEAFFKTLESMQWERDNGHVEFMPIVVGVP